MKLHHLLATAVLLAGSTLVHAKGGHYHHSSSHSGSFSAPRPTVKSTTTIKSTTTFHKPTTTHTTVTTTIKGGKGTAHLIRHPKTLKAFGSTTKFISTTKYASTYGVKLKSGFFGYKGKSHNHFTRR